MRAMRCVSRPCGRCRRQDRADACKEFAAMRRAAKYRTKRAKPFYARARRPSATDATGTATTPGVDDSSSYETDQDSSMDGSSVKTEPAATAAIKLENENNSNS